MDFRDPRNVVCVEPELNPGAIKQWLSIIKDGKKMEKGSRRTDFTKNVKKHLSALGWVFSYAYKGTKRELSYKSPTGKWFYSLATACLSFCVDEEDNDSTEEQQIQQRIVHKDELPCGPRNLSLGLSNFDVSKRKRKTVEDCSITDLDKPKKKTKLVKDCDVASVKMVSSFDVSNQNQKKERNRTEDCEINHENESEKKRKQDAFNGSTRKEEEKNSSSDDYIEIILNIDESDDEQEKNKRVDTAAFHSSLTPSEEIRLRSGKSLRRILEVMDEKKKGEKESLRFCRKDCGLEMNCDVCCVCHFGGELLLCDGCPSAFHHTCLGLSSVPEEDLWFCPCCCCDICKSMDSPSSSGNSMLMSCEQCQRRFHLKCLEEGGSSCVVSRSGWFCNSQCERVFTALQNLLGCKIPVLDDLVWTLIRAPSEYEWFDDEKISKLDSAVKILHQGFEPTTDPFSGKDLVEEMIFRTDRGFYTVILERKNEPVTVAAIRVGKDEAEIPLVATLWSHRRSGMCRLLMDELEKQMCGMGVCRLVLPAATEVVTTWTQRFGFSMMESSERLEVVKHGMLDFVGTIMCQKFLLMETQQEADSGDSSLTE